MGTGKGETINFNPLIKYPPIHLTRQHGQHHRGHHVVHQIGKEQIVVVQHSRSFISRPDEQESQHQSNGNVHTNSQVGQSCVSFPADDSTAEQSLQLVPLVRRLGAQVSVALGLRNWIFLTQLLQFQHFSSIREPIHALSVGHASDHAVQVVLAIFPAGQFDD